MGPPPTFPSSKAPPTLEDRPPDRSPRGVKTRFWELLHHKRVPLVLGPFKECLPIRHATLLSPNRPIPETTFFLNRPGDAAHARFV